MRVRSCMAPVSAMSSSGGSGSSAGSASRSAATSSTSWSNTSRVRCRVCSSSRSRASGRPVVTVSRVVTVTVTACAPSRVARVDAGMMTRLWAWGPCWPSPDSAATKEPAAGGLGAGADQAQPGRGPHLQQRVVQVR